MSFEPTFPSTSRVEAFSDGVIAIILTIMVLDLRPPGHAIDHDSLHGLMGYLTPRLSVYAMSFVIVARIWVSHHQLLFAASHTTPRLMWLNLLLLFFMSLIPFATGYLGEDPFRELAVASYSTVMFLTAATFTWLRYYVTTHLRDVEHAGHLHPDLMKRSYLGMALYALGVPCAYVSVYVSYLLFILVPVISFLNDMRPRGMPGEAGAPARDAGGRGRTGKSRRS
jgi:TMEM175 potassium channel family protein